MTTIYLFPGQGSQRLGMGGELFGKYAQLVRRAESVLGYSLTSLCSEGPVERLSNTRFTQPALFVVCALMYLEQVKTTGKVPDYVAGHSVGEYCALFAAGAFDFLTGVELVKKRGELMAEASGGGMSAVIGMNAERVKLVLGEGGLESLDIANYNAPDQTVISGPKEDLDAAKPLLERSGARVVVPIKVSAAFHSRYMRPSAAAFGSFLAPYRFSRLKIPVIANVHAMPYEDGAVANNLTQQVSHPVKWTQSIEYLSQTHHPQFHEIGPGHVLTNLVKQIVGEALAAA